MTIEYFTFNEATVIESSTLSLSKAKALVVAIHQNSDYQLFECLRTVDGSEIVVIDVICSTIPNRNEAGLWPRERLAIVVNPNASELPVVRALRKDFPRVMHLNGTLPNRPLELCLYFEPRKVVLRTWTAPQFLQRIQWWLENTAAGTLHAIDQPLELPFFDSGWEMVLPFNFDAVNQKPKQCYEIEIRGAVRANEALTLQLNPTQNKNQGRWGFLSITCEPLLQGRQTMGIPPTLGSLAEELATRGVDLLDALQKEMADTIDAQGERVGTGGDRFIILLNIPISRQAGVAPERYQRLAFLLAIGRLDLGIHLGSYMEHNEHVYTNRTIGGLSSSENEWQALTILPVAVLESVTSERLRDYSGVQVSGPASGVLIGSGALGSALIDLWVRCGWGKWYVVDSDHVKPHNLARHRSTKQCIGEAKADIAKSNADAVAPDIVLGALVADACDQNNAQLQQWLSDADIILDCSTTLEFPRLASLSNHRGRHASVFITPNGMDAILLIEDRSRAYRLNTLESQYYRAIINSDWGKRHLTSNLSKFWSGASCRDISLRLEYSAVLVHSANFAQQIPQHLEKDDPAIKVWSRDRLTGSVQAIDVRVKRPKNRLLENLRLHWDEGVEARLIALRQQFLPKETGGVLVGYFDLNLNEIVIVDALPPPLDSIHASTHFIRGIEGLLDRITDIQQRTANIVGYIGEWHSHPCGHSARPSRDDFIQLHKLAGQLIQDGLPALQVIVADNEISFQICGEIVR